MVTVAVEQSSPVVTPTEKNIYIIRHLKCGY